MKTTTEQTVNYHFHIEGGQGTTINMSNGLNVAPQQVNIEKKDGHDDGETLDLLEKFAREYYDAISGSLVDFKNVFEVERIKRGVDRKNTIGWDDLNREPKCEEQSVKLVLEAYHRNLLPILGFAISKRHVPLWKCIQKNPKLSGLFV